MTTLKRVPFLVLALLAFTACASGGGAGGYAETEEPTTLAVENHSTLVMNIYLLRESGQRRRIGQASPLTTTNFTIPSNLVFGVTELRFQADPVGSTRMPITNSVPVSPGDDLLLVIPAG